MDAVRQLLSDAIGLDANSLGESTLEWAARQRMATLNVSGIAEYSDLLQRDPSELAALIELVVVPESWFFREPAAFQLLEKHAGDLMRQPSHVEPVRLLSLPCSTGEEPYSIAMTLLQADLARESFQIDAMDVSAVALRRAETASYSTNSFRGGELAFRERFFLAVDAQNFRLNSEVRELVRFRPGNILRPEGWLIPQAYDIIFCRNLLIYMDAPGRQKTVQTLRALLKPGGIIFVGHAEIPEMVKAGFHRCAEPRSFACCWLEPESVSLPSPRFVAPVNAASLPIAAPQQSLSAAALPADPVALLRRVAALADQGSYPEAASLCRDLLRADPNQAPAYYWLGVIAQAQTRVTAAEEFFHKAIYLDPRHYEALVHLALLREGRGDSTGATLLRQRAQRALQGVSLA